MTLLPSLFWRLPCPLSSFPKILWNDTFCNNWGSLSLISDIDCVVAGLLLFSMCCFKHVAEIQMIFFVDVCCHLSNLVSLNK